MSDAVISVGAAREKQSSAAVWFTHALVANGDMLDVVLQGDAVRLGLHEADSPNSSRERSLFRQDLRALLDRGAEVFYVEEDAAEKGISSSRLLSGIRPVRKSWLDPLFRTYNRVWEW